MMETDAQYAAMNRREGKLHTNAIVKVEVRVTGLLATTKEASKDS